MASVTHASAIKHGSEQADQRGQIGMQVDREFFEIYRVCVDHYLANRTALRPRATSTMLRLLEETVEERLLAIAQVHQSQYKGWRVDTEHPGYLLKIDPPAVFRVPYHLVPSFPMEDQAQAIWQLSRSIRTLDDSVIALSGSGALLRSSVVIGDLDFCEYVKADAQAISGSLHKKIRYSADRILNKIKFNNRIWEADFEEADLLVEFRMIDPSIDERSHGKVDFIARIEKFRPLEATNVLIFCDEDWRSASINRTFAAQEALFSTLNLIPNKLANPSEIGRYIVWLLDQIGLHCRDENYAKALKRSLSLSRFCYLPHISKIITAYISTSYEINKTEMDEADNLIKKLITLDVPNTVEWVLQLEHYKEEVLLRIKRLKLQDSPVQELKDFVLYVAERLRNELVIESAG